MPTERQRRRPRPKRRPPCCCQNYSQVQLWLAAIVAPCRREPAAVAEAAVEAELCHPYHLVLVVLVVGQRPVALGPGQPPEPRRVRPVQRLGRPRRRSALGCRHQIDYRARPKARKPRAAAALRQELAGVARQRRRGQPANWSRAAVQVVPPGKWHGQPQQVERPQVGQEGRASIAPGRQQAVGLDQSSQVAGSCQERTGLVGSPALAGSLESQKPATQWDRNFEENGKWKEMHTLRWELLRRERWWRHSLRKLLRWEWWRHSKELRVGLTLWLLAHFFLLFVTRKHSN